MRRRTFHGVRVRCIHGGDGERQRGDDQQRARHGCTCDCIHTHHVSNMRVTQAVQQIGKLGVKRKRFMAASCEAG